MTNKVPRRAASAEAAGETPAPAAARGEPDPGTAVGSVVDRSLARRRATAEDEVQRLVAAAFVVIEQSGQIEPKVSEILRESGLSNQAFYRHFRGKHELLVTVLDEGIRGLAGYLEQRMEGVEDAALAAREWIRGMAAQALDPSGARASRPFALARGRLAERFPVEVASSERRVAAPLRAALERGRSAGTMPDVDPELESQALYHMIMGWVEGQLVAGRMPEQREVDGLEAFALAGLMRSGTAKTGGGREPRDGSEE